MLFVSLPAMSAAVFASEETTTTESTESTTTTTEATTEATTSTTTAAPENGVAVSQVFCYGSNSKLYNQLIKYSKVSEQYTANVSVPMWMTSLEINIKSEKGAKITIDGTEFSSDGSLFTHKIEFDAATKYKTTTYKILIKKDDKQSTLTFNLAQSVFETKLESISVDGKTADGTNEEGYKYILPTGTTSCRIKIKTRSEESVTLGKAGEEPEKIEINSDKVFLKKVELTEGENVFDISVSAPGTTIKTTLTVTVGEPVISSDVSSEIPSEPVEEITSESDIPDFPGGITEESSRPEPSSVVNIPEEVEKGTSPLIWVLIGVVIAVVIGACIFMIASMGGGNKHRSSGNYSRQYNGNMYRSAPPVPARRRDLGRFVEDDYGYDDYYGEQPPQYPEDNYYSNDEYYQDEGYYQDGKYYDDPGRGGYQDRYERQPQRQQYQSQRRGNRNDYDEFYDDYYN